ncbi:MAG TPA: TIGR02281 family clan AA aspartic protease, partial [Pseudolabrys sp.]
MRLYILFGILGAGLVLLILNHDGGRTLGIDNNDFG